PSLLGPPEEEDLCISSHGSQTNINTKKKNNSNNSNIPRIRPYDILEELAIIDSSTIYNTNYKINKKKKDKNKTKHSTNHSNNNKFKDFTKKERRFLKTINTKLSRYSSNVSSNYKNIDQDYFDKVRFQEISYKFSKTYF
ncbi:hypothetical protein Kpol_520p1, partial [Vanderwaltozyma polyspora DSM 70294]